jgi:hypothetical protein
VRVNITPHMIRTHNHNLHFLLIYFLLNFFSVENLGAKAISWEMIRAVHHKYKSGSIESAKFFFLCRKAK